MFILLNYVAINAQGFDKSYITQVGPDHCLRVLNFDDANNYEYLGDDLEGGREIIEKGTFQKIDNKIILNAQVSNDNDPIPDTLYYAIMSKKEFDNLGHEPFTYSIKNYFFWKRYHVLTKKP